MLVISKETLIQSLLVTDMTIDESSSQKEERKLLVAVDSTDQSIFTLNWALEHCSTKNDIIVLLHAYEIDTLIIAEYISDDHQIQQLNQKVNYHQDIL
jgi:hypothetical protein